MAKFGEKVLDFKDVLKFYRIPVSCSDDKIFLNLGKNSVVKVCDQELLHTWTLTHPHHFTSPVVCSEGNIYCAMDNNVLLKWSENEDNLMNAKKLQFQECIFTVLCMDGELLVLFNSGKYATVDTASFVNFKLFDFAFLKENEKLIWADAYETSNHLEVFCLACGPKSKNNTIYYFIVNKEDKEASNLCIKNLSRDKAALKSWCLNHTSILSFWSDGTICSHDVKDSKDSKLLSLKNIDANTIGAIASIDFTHIIVVSINLKQKECVLEMWDSKSGTFKARKVFETSSLVNIQIFAADSKIFLLHNKELVSIPFDIENNTFGATISRSSENDKNLKLNWDESEISTTNSKENSLHNKELVSVPLRIETPMFATAVSKSLSKNDKIEEFLWCDIYAGANTELKIASKPSIDEPEAMEVCNPEHTVDSIESIANRLLNGNSEYLTLQELELTKLLQFAIRYTKDETGNDSCSKNEVYFILNRIFSTTFNDYILVNHLRKLNSEEALVALELLLSYLNHTVKIPSNIATRPSDLQVVNWASLIMQTHVEDILLSKDKTSQKLLKQMKMALSVKIEEYEDFDCIQNYFSVIEKKDLLPQKCSVGKYCVESLDV